MFFLVFDDLHVRKKWRIALVFSVGLHIALFASSSVWHQFLVRFFIDFRLILTPFSLVFHIKIGIKMNADFRIDFLKTFDILLTHFGSIHRHFHIPWSHFGCKMEAKKHQIIEKVWVSRISHPISQNPLFLTPILLHYPPTLFAIFRPRPLQGPGASPRSIFPSPGDSGRLLGGNKWELSLCTSASPTVRKKSIR